MTDAAALLTAARHWIDLVEAAGRLPSKARIEALTAHLVHLYAAGLRLPETGPAPASLPTPPWPADWPDLGELDRARPPVTLLLKGITSDLAIGIAWAERDPKAGAAWLRSTFDARWGTLCLAAVQRLHVALQEARSTPAAASPPPAPRPASSPTPNSTPAPRPATPPAASPAPARPTSSDDLPLTSTESRAGTSAALLQHVPEPPRRRATGRARPRPDDPGILGVRCEPTALGLRVEAIHPAGPAADLLLEGDLLTAIDGHPLAGLDRAGAQAALSSASGQRRELTLIRDERHHAFSLVAVDPNELRTTPTALRVRLLDVDGAYALLGEIGGALHASPDPELDDHLVLAAAADAPQAHTAAVAAGVAAGCWEVVGPA